MQTTADEPLVLFTHPLLQTDSTQPYMSFLVKHGGFFPSLSAKIKSWEASAGVTESLFQAKRQANTVP